MKAEWSFQIIVCGFRVNIEGKGDLVGGLVITGVFTFKAGAGFKIGCMNTKLDVFIIKSNKIGKTKSKKRHWSN